MTGKMVGWLDNWMMDRCCMDVRCWMDEWMVGYIDV